MQNRCSRTAALVMAGFPAIIRKCRTASGSNKRHALRTEEGANSGDKSKFQVPYTGGFV